MLTAIADSQYYSCADSVDENFKDHVLSMALNVTAQSLGQSLNVSRAAHSANTKLEVPDGTASEHIYITGDEPESCDEPSIVGKRCILSNPVRGLRTELTFFDEGFLQIREYRRKRLSRDYMLQLRFLKPKPVVVRRVVVQSLWTAVGLTGAAGLSWLISHFTSPGGYLFSASLALATGALVSFLLFIYQSGTKTIFGTATGNAQVLTLTTSFGCFRRSRMIVPEISQAIGAAIAKSSFPEDLYLRGEMQEHYRLRNEGIISPKDCSKGTARILSRFG